MGIRIGGEVERINGRELSYSKFAKRFMAQNRPVVLAGLMDDWRACTDWVTGPGNPNLPFFAANFGQSIVQVADCGTREFADQKRVEMSVSEFVDQWIQGSLQSSAGASNRVARDKPVLYLKDWHFVKEYPEYKAYTTPKFFCDDWLNLYLDNYRLHVDPDVYSENNEISCSDYRFVYMGEKGSWTPLHADVFRSYSWSGNVCGKKRWLLLSPSQKHLVFDRNMKSSVYNIFDDVSEADFPGFKEAIWLECIQEQNEILFVPSGWYHQVHNLEDTISINHNWFNGHNLHWVWDLLLEDYNEAKGYIQDIKDTCDDFESICQRNLAANTGMNFQDFFGFLGRLCLSNLVHISHLQTANQSIMFDTSPLTSSLIKNVGYIRGFAKSMRPVEEFNLNIRETLDDPRFQNLLTVSVQTFRDIFVQPVRDQHFNRSRICDFRDPGVLHSHGSCVSTLEDLVKLIDRVVLHCVNRI